MSENIYAGIHLKIDGKEYSMHANIPQEKQNNIGEIRRYLRNMADSVTRKIRELRFPE